MTDRDHFAAAALAGLLANGDYGMESTPGLAWGMADAMLRERGNHIADSGKMVETPEETQDCPTSTPQVPPMPRTPQSDRLTEWERHGSHRWGLGVASDLYDLECRVAALEKGSAATPTAEQSRFNAAVMNWISEATSVWAEACRSDGGRKIMRDACMSCWDAYCPTNHDAAPAARASVESVAPQPTTRGDSDRTDKAAPRPSEGTGDTPDSPKPIKGGVSDRSKPINGPDPDSRVWETPVHTPAPHATPGEGSVPREGTQEPVAWAVCTPSDGHWSPCYFHEPHAQRCANAIVGEKNVVPLYRHPPTLTDAEREAIERGYCSLMGVEDMSAECTRWDAEAAAVLRGLLERTK